MSINDQPSVLTVCVPGTSAEPGALDLNEILAARRQASARSAAFGGDATESTRAECSRPDCSKSGSQPGPQCDACDESACGVKIDGDLASGREFAGSELAGSELDGRPSGGLSGGEEQLADSNDPVATVGVSFFHADSGKKALELLRMLRFDLLVTGDRLPDMPIGHFLRRVRVAWPWQKWAMVGSSLTAQDEIAARTLGAMAVFDAPPDWEVLSSLAIAAADKAAGLKLALARERGADRLPRLDSDRTQSFLQDQVELLRPLAAASVASHAMVDRAAPANKTVGSRRAPVISRRVSKRSAG